MADTAKTKRKAKTKTPPKKVSRVALAGERDPRLTALLGAFKADPTLASIVDAFEDDKRVPHGRKFGSNGLKVHGKLFALFTQGTLVVKLPHARVAELVAARVGENFDPGHGRLMKQWLSVTSPSASWTGLAREAHDFVKTVSR